MSLDPGSLVASLFVSSVGYVFFSYGRKQRRFPHTAMGILMMVYPYFISDVVGMLAVLPALILVLWLLTRLGM